MITHGPNYVNETADAMDFLCFDLHFLDRMRDPGAIHRLFSSRSGGKN